MVLRRGALVLALALGSTAVAGVVVARADHHGRAGGGSGYPSWIRPLSQTAQPTQVEGLTVWLDEPNNWAFYSDCDTIHRLTNIGGPLGPHGEGEAGYAPVCRSR